MSVRWLFLVFISVRMSIERDSDIAVLTAAGQLHTVQDPVNMSSTLK